MSSCCTLRLNRRKAFSRDSPSCILTSANLAYTPQLVQNRLSSYGRGLKCSQDLCSAALRRSEFHAESELHLSRRIRIGRLQRIAGDLIVPREVIDSKLVTHLHKECRVALHRSEERRVGKECRSRW